MVADVLEAVASGLSGLASFVGDITGGMIDSIVGLLTAPDKVVSAAAQMGVSVVVGFFDGIASMLTDVGSFIAGLFSGGGDTAKKSGFGLGLDLVTGIAKGVLFGPLILVESLLELFGVLDGSFSLTDKVADIGVSIVQAIAGGVLSVPGLIVDAIAWLFGGLASTVIGAVDSIREAFGGLVDLVGGYVSVIVGIVTTVGSVFGSVFGFVADLLGGIGSFLSALGRDFTILADHARQAGGVLGWFAMPLDYLATVASGLGTALETLGGILGWVAGLLGGGLDLAALIPDLSVLDPVIDGLDSFVGYLAGLGSSVFNAVVSWVSSLDGWIYDGIMGGLGALYDIGARLVDILVDSASGVLSDVFVSPVLNALSFAGDVAGTAASAGQRLVDWVVGGILSVPGIVASAVRTVITEAFGAVGNYLPDIPIETILAPLTGLASMLSGVFEFVGGVVDNVLIPFRVLGDVLEWVSLKFSQAAGVFESLPGPLKALAGPLGFISYIFNLFSKGARLPITLAEGIASVPGVVVNAVVDVLSDVLPFLPGSDARRGPLSDLTRAGAGIMKALASGVLSAPGAVLSALSSVLSRVGGAVWNAAKNLGGRIARGISRGVQKGVGMVKGAIDATVSAAKGAANTGVDVATGAVDTAGDMAGRVGSAAGGLWSAGKGLVGSGVGKLQSAASGIQSAANGFDIGGAMSSFGGVGNQLINVAGLTPPVTPTAAGGPSITHKNDNRVDNRTTQVQFYGEVHDVKQVNDKIRRGEERAKKSMRKDINDDLDAGLDNF